ncbi:small ribosomal subunit biogenesis GTPase RsgA [Myxosarcina sp. GI1]|uniref:small ribosomal subunit biogenesis GTPase RsgA n=1 Tax=Myxosarcina sp. GI1 TaxID=1541065 RepID=UPI000562A4B6|nr:small ribosomal subunit biogenesis GTPase RsgA [Myxosarcina sp. GI1]
MADESLLEKCELWGTVVAVQANFYQVRLESNLNSRKTISQQYLLCTRRSRLKKIGQKVIVGDRVVIEEPDWQDNRGAISRVLPRQTVLQRPPVANADCLLLMFAVREPTLDPWQLSRFLVKAESTNIKSILGLNKCDLIEKTERDRWQQRLQSWGYEPLFISVTQKLGLENLLKFLRDKITVVAGPSGVGKSSTIETLIPSIDLRVGEVSGKLQRGRHTTRHVELFELPEGGLLADSPGFNQPDLNCDPANLAWYFPEARARLKQDNCQFGNCLHRDEPNCVVRGDWERYEHYLNFLEIAIAKEEARQQTPDTEQSLKLKVKRSGKKQYEPRLESKKYRRPSRREKHQNLQDIYSDRSVEEIYEELED